MNKNVRVLFVGDSLIGTITIEKNHISRLFIAPIVEKNGYETYILHSVEEEIGTKYNSITLESSLPAVCFYEKRGYKTVTHNQIITSDNSVLVYEVMEKLFINKNF